MTNEMTNEEAIKRLQDAKDGYKQYLTDEALDMAIKALETIPKYKDAYGKGWDDGAKASYEHLKMCEEEQSGDLISRQVVQTELKNCEVVDIYDENDNFVGYYNADTVDSIVRNLPPINPQEPKTGQFAEWIPVSEGLPIFTINNTVSEDVLVFDGVDIRVGEYRKGKYLNGAGYWRVYGYELEEYVDVIAWMPLPKPYEPQERSGRE